jgi:hypothetical protein
MLEVIHDTAMPCGSDGTARPIAKGNGMYEVAYDR